VGIINKNFHDRLRDVAKVTEFWRESLAPSFGGLTFHNRWENRNMDARVNTPMTRLRLLKFGELRSSNA